jgi:DNA-binding SARP family transcriptional activator
MPFDSSRISVNPPQYCLNRPGTPPFELAVVTVALRSCRGGIVDELEAPLEQESTRCRLLMLNGFELAIDDQVVEVVSGSQRLLALLALAGVSMTRTEVVNNLWPNKDRARGFANLRSSHWRLPPKARELVTVADDRLSIASSVTCDVSEMRRQVAWLLTCDRTQPPNLTVTELIAPLLPFWYEDWVQTAREELDRMRVRALEVLCEQFTAQGRFGEAIEAGLSAVTSEPLRESAHKVLITAHLAEGNRSEAHRHYALYEELLDQELGVAPSPDLQRLVSGRSLA